MEPHSYEEKRSCNTIWTVLFFFLYRKAPLGRTKLIDNFKTFGAFSWFSMNKQSSYNE